MFIECVYDDMRLTKLLSCLTTVSISFCLSLSFFRNWEKMLFFLLVSFILHREKEEEWLWQDAYMPNIITDVLTKLIIHLLPAIK